MVYCGDCGGVYGPKAWHATDKYRKTVWQCNKKYASGTKCSTPVFSEEELQRIFISAFNKLSNERDEIKATFEDIQQTVFNTESLEAELHQIQDELNLTAELLEQNIRKNATIALDQTVYNSRYEEVRRKYDELKSRSETLEMTIQDKVDRKAEAAHFIKVLMKQPLLVTEFDPIAFRMLVDRMTVFRKDRVVVRFKNGIEIDM